MAAKPKFYKEWERTNRAIRSLKGAAGDGTEINQKLLELEKKLLGLEGRIKKLEDSLGYQADPDRWTVRGVVKDHTGTGKKDVTVSVFDKDVLIDDALGAVTTNQAGSFELHYRTQDFKSDWSFFENNPDIYLIINDSGREYRTKVRYEAGRIEEFEIKLPDPKDSKASAVFHKTSNVTR